MPRSRITYANVMATVAVFIALGGTGYAVTQLPKDSVDSRQIASDAVRKAELEKDAVASPEVANASIKAVDLKAGTLPGSFAETSGTLDPPPSPDNSFLYPGFPFDTPASGKLLVRLDALANPVGSPGGMTADCSAGTPTVGLYLYDYANDVQTPIQNTGIELQDNTWTDFAVTGVTAEAIPAGRYQVEVGVDCPQGDVDTYDVSSTSTEAVVFIDG